MKRATKKAYTGCLILDNINYSEKDEMDFGKVLKFAWDNRQLLATAISVLPAVNKVITPEIVESAAHTGKNIYDARNEIKEAMPEIGREVANNAIDLAAQLGYSMLKNKLSK